MTVLRTANLLGTLAAEIARRVDENGRTHPNQTTSSAAALNVLAMAGTCSNGTLAQALGLSHTAAVRLVDRLESEGLVASEPAEDRRAVSLRLTERGREAAVAVLRARCAVLAPFVELLTPEQRTHLDAISETLLRAMVASPRDDWRICRLCDTVACPPEECPVHQRALQLAAA